MAEGPRPAVAEYLTRANFGLALGNFELDMDRGVVGYKTTHLIERSVPLSESTIAHTVIANLAMMDRYLPAMLAVVSGQATPQQAVEQAEARREEGEESSVGGSSSPRRPRFDPTPGEN